MTTKALAVRARAQAPNGPSYTGIPGKCGRAERRSRTPPARDAATGDRIRHGRTGGHHHEAAARTGLCKASHDPSATRLSGNCRRAGRRSKTPPSRHAANGDRIRHGRTGGHHHEAAARTGLCQEPPRSVRYSIIRQLPESGAPEQDPTLPIRCYRRSNRSRFITLVQASTKSLMNFSPESAWP